MDFNSISSRGKIYDHADSMVTIGSVCWRCLNASIIRFAVSSVASSFSEHKTYRSNRQLLIVSINIKFSLINATFHDTVRQSYWQINLKDKGSKRSECYLKLDPWTVFLHSWFFLLYSDNILPCSFIRYLQLQRADSQIDT